MAAKRRPKKVTFGKTKIYFDITLQFPLVLIPSKVANGQNKEKGSEPKWQTTLE